MRQASEPERRSKPASSLRVGGMRRAAGGRPRRRRQEGPFAATVTLGRVAGVEIGLNWSWIVIVGLIIWSLAAEVFPADVPGLSSAEYLVMAAIAAVVFFACLVLHELGHAVTARREGMEIAGITLWLFGGVAQFKGLFPSAGAELRIALAGPAVTLVIAVVLLSAAALLSLPDAVDGVVTWLGAINLILLVFNMLPALPLDGGRVLRALLWRATGDFTRATRIAGGLGQGFGRVMIALGVVLAVLAAAPGGIWLAVIGLFLTVAARAESSLATMKAALEGLRVGDAMAAAPRVVRPDITLETFLDGEFADSRHAAYPVAEDGRVSGLLWFRDVVAVPARDRRHVVVGDVAIPLSDALVLAPDDDLGDAAMKLVQTAPARALVIDDERLAGLLSVTDVSRLIELHSRRGARAPKRLSERVVEEEHQGEAGNQRE